MTPSGWAPILMMFRGSTEHLLHCTCLIFQDKMEFISFLHGFRRHNHIVVQQFMEFGTNRATKEDLENKEQQTKFPLPRPLPKFKHHLHN